MNMINTSNLASEQTFLPLSQSELLQDQTQYYKAMGVDAWNHKLPFQATNNNFAAYTYARLFIALVKDRVLQSDYQPGSPFYVLEIGAGIGSLAYRFRKQFEELKTIDPVLADVNLIYILSDVAQKNIDFWHDHPQLVPLFEQGKLESAYLDLLADQPIRLIQSGDVLNEELLNNPLMVISNYVFDTLPQDVYRITQGKLQLGMLAKDAVLSLPRGNNVPLYLDNLGKQFLYKEVDISEDISFESQSDRATEIGLRVLSSYQAKFSEIGFSFPSQGITALVKLKQRINAPMVWLIADKALKESDLFDSNGYQPSLVRHDHTWSLEVNLDSISRAAIELDGRCIVQTMNTTAITQAVIFFGIKPKLLPHFEIQLRETFHNQSLGHSNQVINSLRKASPPNYPEFIAHWQQSQFDLVLFNDYWPVLKPNINQANQHFYPELWSALSILVDYYFAHPGEEVALLSIAECYMAAELWLQGIEVLELNLSLNTNCTESQYLRAICMANIGRKTQALDIFQIMRIKEGDNIEVLGWCRKLQQF